MEIKITTTHFLKVLHLLSWIIFVGLCVNAGGILINTFYSMHLNPLGAKYFWDKMDLSALYELDKGYFLELAIILLIVSVLKALLFYCILKIFQDKDRSIEQPFKIKTNKMIATMAYIALGIGLFSSWGENKAIWFSSKGIVLPSIQNMRLDGADVWFFMGIILLVISKVFKQGEILQSENDLTI